MGKKYLVKNITTTPARPIGLMCCASGGALGAKGNYRVVSTDSEGITLSEPDYNHCKDALKRFEDSDMVFVKEIIEELTGAEKKEIADREANNAKAQALAELESLRGEAKALKIPSYHVMGIDKLKVEIKKAIEALKDKED